MLVPSMTLPEIRKEFMKDSPIVYRKGDYLLKSLKHATQPHGDEKIDRYIDYLSKYKNNWIIRCELTRRTQYLTFLAYYYNNVGLVALTTLHNEKVFIYHTSHMFKRLNERLNLNLKTPRDILIAFMRENEAYQTKWLDQIKPGVYKVFSATPMGYFLGTYDQNIKFMKLNTFITHEMLKGDQISLADRLKIELEKYIMNATNLH